MSTVNCMAVHARDCVVWVIWRIAKMSQQFHVVMAYAAANLLNLVLVEFISLLQDVLDLDICYVF